MSRKKIFKAFSNWSKEIRKNSTFFSEILKKAINKSFISKKSFFAKKQKQKKRKKFEEKTTKKRIECTRKE